MDRAAILKKINQHSDEILDKCGAKHLSLFGSVARDELHDDNDIDVLVEFEGAVTYDGYFDLKEFLELMLCRRVDLVTDKGLKPRARRHVEKDLIRVA